MSKKQVSQFDFDGTWKLSPFGEVLMQRDFFCMRCGKIERFSISNKEFNAIKEEDDADDALVVRKILEGGWLFSIAMVEGTPREYVLCPHCVRNDFTRFQNYQKVFGL